MKAYFLVISTLLLLLCGWLIATEEAADLAPREAESPPALSDAIPGVPGPPVSAADPIEQRIDGWVDARVTRLLEGASAPGSATSAIVLLPDLYAREWATYLLLSARLLENARVDNARRGDPADLTFRTDRLAEAWLQLLDPVWGGVHARTPLQAHLPLQARTPSIDTGGPVLANGNLQIDADYEKRLSDQAGALRVFAAAYERTREERYLRAIERVDAYLLEWLADGEGLFFAGQSGTPADPRQRIGAPAYWQLRSEHQRRNFGLPARDDDRPPAANRALSIAYRCAYRVTSDPNHLALARRIEVRLGDPDQQEGGTDALRDGEMSAQDWSAERVLAQAPEAVDGTRPLPEGLAEFGLQLRSAPAEGSGCGLGEQPEPEFEPLSEGQLGTGAPA